VSPHHLWTEEGALPGGGERIPAEECDIDRYPRGHGPGAFALVEIVEAQAPSLSSGKARKFYEHPESLVIGFKILRDIRSTGVSLEGSDSA
jgi:hypothetical protein